MPEMICFFQDYLSAMPSSEKRDMLYKSEVEVIGSPADGRGDFPGGRFGQDISPQSDLPRHTYRALVEDLRGQFGRNAAVALSALISGGEATEAAMNLSGRGREALGRILEFSHESPERVLSWAANPENWYLVESGTSPVTLQSRVWNQFPCIVFGNGPIECAATGDPDLRVDRMEEILQSTGIYELWQDGNFGQEASCVVLDTGAGSFLQSDGVAISAVGSLSAGDLDGHGSAVIGIIRALCPKVQIESICVSQSYSGGQIWNLISGLTRLFGRKDTIVNLSLGVAPDWIRGLGPQGTGFKEALSAILSSLAAEANFPISAAGNDGIPDLRWPSAAPDSLAVGSHNASFSRSSFSNFQSESRNLVLAPGGEIRQMDGRIEGYGRYGQGLTREIYGTSFSTAVASAVACLLMRYTWFREMQVRSRISLFRNHCRENSQGFPILNIVDIGAVWPL
jgi:Subtilase family